VLLTVLGVHEELLRPFVDGAVVLLQGTEVRLGRLVGLDGRHELGGRERRGSKDRSAGGFGHVFSFFFCPVGL